MEEAPIYSEDGVDLALICLCLRACSWPAWSAGTCAAPEIASFVSSGAMDAAVLYASVARSRPALEAAVATLLPACSRTGTLLVLAGAGPWPSPGSPASLARTTGELQAWIEGAEHRSASESRL